MKLLLLAGTGEARRIAEALPAIAGVEAVASLAGGTRVPATLGVPVRSGGFGGRQAFADYLGAEGIGAVLDATHPFAIDITRRTAEVCADLGLPYAQVLRRGWTPGPGDRWTFVDREEQVADLVPDGSTVFLGTGTKGLERFANLTGREVICRRIETPDAPFPFPGGRFLQGRPPFSVAEEVALFTKLGVDWLVVKNSGGAASRSKLDAARDLGLPVALLNRPAQPAATRFETEAEALEWVRRLAA
ncbi:cobalt-precorrin-6A reductase [Psychromarinibacter halotolerans]|uniref:Cobalt-precorrin-6A reductase n=1 Tax=Psychromarinibacter halotolerans TaxID=1775175 RepID=A0ABV7GP96_9RHOB|nr:cobalt-precorrin-6A reductase [Psychromarinibacter halotolerans]MDF0594486.1 cobalt-precorrin-6A reductase [Psychromarinibacter halotolerans]